MQCKINANQDENCDIFRTLKLRVGSDLKRLAKPSPWSGNAIFHRLKPAFISLRRGSLSLCASLQAKAGGGGGIILSCALALELELRF